MRVRTTLLALIFPAAAGLAQVPDPTRPPDNLVDASGAAAASPAAGVQAVFLRQGAKPAALVNGEYVVQGGMLGDRRVLKITETEVVLRDSGGQKEVMKVIADAEKKPVVEKAAVSRGKPNSGATKGATNEGASKK